MPKIVDALRPPEETRTVDDVGAAVENRSEELAVVLGIVFKVGVLHQDDVARGGFKAAPERRSLSAILILEQEADSFQRKAGLAVLREVSRSPAADWALSNSCSSPRVPSVEPSSMTRISLSNWTA